MKNVETYYTMELLEWFLLGSGYMLSCKKVEESLDVRNNT